MFSKLLSKNILHQNKSYKQKAWMICMLLVFAGMQTFAQAPSNDEPCNAIPLTVGATCTFTTYTTTNATNSTAVPGPGCANFSGGDVWFSIIVPAGGAILVDAIQGGITDGGMAVYMGACNSLTMLECDDDDSNNGLMPSITRTGLAAGSMVYVRFWEYGNDNAGTFGICVTLPPDPPANDECANAIPIPVNPDMLCGLVTQGTTVAATQSTGVTAPSCSVAGTNDDVWFSFVAVGTTHLISYQNISGTTDMITQVYSGTCGSLVPIVCSDPEFVSVNGLTPGETYLVRVYTWSSGAGTRSTFNICVGTMPPPPANDECAGATSLTVNPDLNCGIVTAGSTASSSASTTGGAPAPACFPSGANDDIWYSFVATSAQHQISLLNVTGPVTDMIFELYSGSCTALTSIDCSDPNTMNVGSLTIGATYYVRVWTYTSTASSFANFQICIGTPPPPPAYDNPCNAVMLNTSYTCNYSTFTTQSATSTSGVPAPGCASYSGGDVWLKAVVPCGGSIKINSIQGGITDGGMALYTGTCDNLTLVDCDDDGSENGLMPSIIANNLTPGDTVYIRFWEYGNDNQNDFGICVTIPPLPAQGSACASANPFCTSQSYTVPNTTGVPSIGGNGVYGCLGSTPNPAWYYMQVQTAGDIIIGISQTSTSTGTGIDVDYAVWGPFASLAATCTGLTAANNISCSYSPDPTETATILNAQPGQYYMILLTNYSDQPGTITFQQTGGGGQSNCADICSITASNSGPICPGGTVNLSTPGITNATYLWTGPNCFESTLQNPTNVTPPTEPGTYTYVLTATTPTGNSCNTSTQVVVSPTPALGADSTVLSCANTAVNLFTIYDTTGLISSWTLNGNTVGNPAAVDVSGVYQLIASNASNCNDTSLVTVVMDTVTVTLDAVNANCTSEGSITVNANSGIEPFTYSISTAPTVFQASNEFTVAPGDYEIITMDSLGCTISNQVTIGFTDNLELTTIPAANICNGQSVALTTTGNAETYSWSPATGLSDPNIASPIASPSVNTLYTVTATLGSCTRTEQVQISIGGQVTANAGPDISIVSGEQATIHGSATGNINSVTWTPVTGLSSANSLITNVIPTSPGTTTYTLTVTNALGCVDSDEMNVNVIPFCINVRNAFSPNGDGINDQWQVYDDFACLKNVSVNVFNRYGNLVFQARDYRNRWDGTYKGKPVPDGTYYAVLDFSMINGRKFTSKTDLTILR